jgi:hypothetical protein
MLGSRCKPLSFPSNGKDSSSVACCWALLAFLLVFFIPYEKNCFHLFAHDMRNEIKQSKQTTKKLRKTYQASKRKKRVKKTNYREEIG